MKPKNTCMLLLTALIWGTAFVAQSVGMDYVQPFTFNGIRSLIGALTLIPVILITDRTTGKKEDTSKESKRTLVTGGVLCGLCLFTASSLQQIGLQYTSAGKAGFITAFYITYLV